MIDKATPADRAFTDSNPSQWTEDLLGPVWLTRMNGHSVPDQRVALGLTRFLDCIDRMTEGQSYSFGTAYATILDDQPVPDGDLHFDTGPRARDRQVLRFSGTWASDGYRLGNLFMRRRDEHVENLLHGSMTSAAPDGLLWMPEDRFVVAFDEGVDLHGRAPAPSRPGQWGVFCSATLYRADQEADLHCPRLKRLADRAPQWIRILQSTERIDF